MDTSKDNPFCDLQFLVDEDSENNNGTAAALSSGDKPTNDTVEHVLKAGSQRISKEFQMTSADLSNCRPTSFEKFASYLRAHNIPDIRAPSQLKADCLTLTPARSSRMSSVNTSDTGRDSGTTKLVEKIKKKSRVSKMLALRKTRNEGPATVGGESVEGPDILILYDSARRVNEVTDVATVQAKKYGVQAIADNDENDLTQRIPRNVADTIVALPKGSDVSCISEAGVVVNGGEELLPAEVDSSLDLVIRGTMSPSPTLVLPTNRDQIAASNQVFLENTVNTVITINKEVLKMASEVEKSGDFDPRVKDSSVEECSALEEVSAVGKEDFGPEKDDNNTKKEKDDCGQGLKISPLKEDYVEIISDYEGDLRQPEGADGTVVLDDDDI